MIARLREFATALLKWNSTTSNLLSHNDELRLVERHLLESIEPIAWLKESGATRWIDLGTGGGLPALPLILSEIPGDWTLVESRRNKCLFLRKTIQEMGLKSVTVVCDRLENVVESMDVPDRDGFTSRATLKLVPTLELAARIVKQGGSAFLWKGTGREGEMLSDSSWRESWQFSGERPIGSSGGAVMRFNRIW